MSLSDETVRHVAKLASLDLSDEEVSEMREQLGEIIEYVNQLSEVATEGVTPTSHVHGVVNTFREDIVKESYSVEEVRALAPDYGLGGFRVPKIVS